jgi:16S rRNA processing protein RimM
MAEYIQIGHTKKTHGVAGEIKVFIEEVFEDLFLGAERVFIEVRGNKVPYFIENVRGMGDFIVQFEEMNNKDLAAAIQSKGVFLPAAEVPASVLRQAPKGLYTHTKGFEMTDEAVGTIGVIEEIMEMPQQEIAVLQYKGKSVMVPLHPEFVRKVDTKKRQIAVSLPEGLLDL